MNALRGGRRASALLGAALTCAGARGADFETVRAAVWASPYAVLPRYAVDRATLGDDGDGPANRYLDAARRTLSSDADLLEFPGHRKLIQSHGICLSGRWRIDAATPWAGALAHGTDWPVIARFSVALDDVSPDARRALGLALKLFPPGGEPSHNVLLLETLAGSRTRHLLDAVFVNEPPLGSLPLSPAGIALGLRLRADSQDADRERHGRADIGRRSIAGLAGPLVEATVPPPRWLRVRAAMHQPRPWATDFRDTLRVERYPGGRHTWVVEVAAAHPRGAARAEWMPAGRIEFDASVVSPGCDGRLHFPHPGAE